MYIVYYWTVLVAIAVMYYMIHRQASRLRNKEHDKATRLLAMAVSHQCVVGVGGPKMVSI